MGATYGDVLIRRLCLPLSVEKSIPRCIGTLIALNDMNMPRLYDMIDT